MIELYAQPYDMNARGFHFANEDDFAAKAKANFNTYGEPVEEYELQVIDYDCPVVGAFLHATKPDQANLNTVLETVRYQSEYDLIQIIAILENGYDLKYALENYEDVSVYEADTIGEVAEQFFEEGYFGKIPDHLQNYIDFEAYGRDNLLDYYEVKIDGTCYFCCMP